MTFTKINWNKKYTTVAAYCLGVIAISVLFVVFVFKFDSFAQGFSWVGSVAAPIICGIIIAYILNPLVDVIERKLFGKMLRTKPGTDSLVIKQLRKSPVANTKMVKGLEKRAPTMEEKIKKRRTLVRVLSIVVAYVIVLAALTGIVIAVVPSVAKSVIDLADQMPLYVEKADEWLQETFANNPDLVKYISGEISGLTDLVTKFADMVKPMSSDIIGNISSGLFKAASAVFTALKNMVIGLVIAIYLLFSKERLLAQIKKMVFAMIKPEKARRLFTTASKSNVIFKQYIVSNLIDALIIFVCMMIGMLVMGMPYPMLIAVVCGVTNLIPFFGPFIGAIPSGFLILLVDPIKVIWFAIFVLVLQQLDGNVLKPLLFGESMGLPAIWVLVSIIVGGGLFGIPGMLLGTPVFAVFYMLFAEYVKDRLERKSMPSSTDCYTVTMEQFDKQYPPEPPLPTPEPVRAPAPHGSSASHGSPAPNTENAPPRNSAKTAKLKK